MFKYKYNKWIPFNGWVISHGVYVPQLPYPFICFVCKTERDTDVQNRLLDSVGEGEGGMFRENSIETCILSRVKQITSSGWMHETSARNWCTGKTQRDWVEREVGEGGSGWGIHITPWLIHVNVWQKPLQYCKVISLQLIKIKEGRKKYKYNSHNSQR